MEWNNLQDGSLDSFNFISDGRRSRLHIMTKEPTENITSKSPFFCHGRFNFQRIGMGRIRITKS